MYLETVIDLCEWKGWARRTCTLLSFGLET